MAAHQQRPGVPRLLRGPLPLRQRHRLPALRLAGGARRVRAEHGRLLERHVRHRAGQRVPPGTTTTGGPLLFYLQSSSPDGIARDAAGASDINNEEFALFVQDKWQAGHGLTLDYGLRWDAQMMPETVDPKTTAFAPFLNDPRFPSDGTIPESVEAVSAARRVRVGRRTRTARSVAARQRRPLLRAAEHAEPGRIGHDQRHPAEERLPRLDVHGVRRHAGVAEPAARRARSPPGTFPLFTGIRVFDRDYQNPRIYSFNVGFERELAPSMAAYVDFTVAKGMHLTRFLNYNVHGTAAAAVQPATRDTTTYTGANPFEPQLGDVFVTNSRGHGALPRRHVRRAQALLAAAISSKRTTCSSKDEDDDSNERDPFTDRSFNFYDLSLDYGPSDRDIRHKFNFFTYAELPQQLLLNVRMQGRTAQPITTSPRVLNGDDRGRNWDRKDNAYFSLDWRLQRPFARRPAREIIPSLEMFNTFNNANNVNPLTTPALFNFDGFLRQGVGDPRQVQLAVKVTF